MKEKDLEKKTAAELRSMAKKQGISPRSGWTKADLIQALVKTKAPKTVKKSAAKKTAKKPLAKVAKKTAKKVAQKTVGKKTAKTAGRKVSKTSMRTAREKAAPAKGTAASPLREKIRPGVPPGAKTHLPLPVPSTSRVTLMVVDPYKLFAFWEVNAQEVERIIRDGEGFATILRTYFFREGEPTGFFDVPVTELSSKKYIEVIPDRGYQVEFGILKGERFFPLAKSRVKHTPTFSIAKGELTPEESEIFLPQMPHPKTRISS